MERSELKDLEALRWEEAQENVSKGDVDRSIELIELFRYEVKLAHDILAEWVWILLTFVSRTFGEEAVEKALRFRHECQDQLAEKLFSLKPEQVLRNIAAIDRGHQPNFRIHEEEERFVIRLDPCGTGGQMLRKGLYNPPSNLGMTKKGYHWSWGKANVSYYCSHCCLHEISAMEKGAPAPLWITECPEDSDASCFQYIYKNPKLVPKKYIQRIGFR